MNKKRSQSPVECDHAQNDNRNELELVAALDRAPLPFGTAEACGSRLKNTEHLTVSSSFGKETVFKNGLLSIGTRCPAVVDQEGKL